MPLTRVPVECARAGRCGPPPVARNNLAWGVSRIFVGGVEIDGWIGGGGVRGDEVAGLVAGRRALFFRKFREREGRVDQPTPAPTTSPNNAPASLHLLPPPLAWRGRGPSPRWSERGGEGEEEEEGMANEEGRREMGGAEVRSLWVLFSGVGGEEKRRRATGEGAMRVRRGRCIV